MASVRYDLDGDSDKLVQALGQAIRALLDTERQAKKTEEAVEDAGSASEKAGTQAKKGASGFSAFAADAAHVTEVAKATVEWVKWLAESFVAVLQRAVEAREGVRDFITAEDNDRVKAFGENAERLGTALDVLAVRFTSDLAPELTNFVNLAIGAADAAGDLFDDLKAIGESDFVRNLNAAGSALRAIVSLGLADDIEAGIAGMVDRGKEMNEQLGTMKLGWMTIKKPSQDVIDAFMRSEKELEAAEKRREEAAKARADAAKEAAAQSEKERQVMLTWLDEQVARDQAAADRYVQAWSGAYDAQMAALHANIEQSKDAIKESVRASEEATKAFEKDLEQRHKSMMSGFGSLADSGTEALNVLFEAMGDRAEQELERISARVEAQQTRVDDLRARARDGDRAAAAALEAEQERLKTLREQERALRIKAFEQDQLAKKGQAVMAGALAAVQAFAQLGPIGGAIATPGIAAMTGIQVGIIEAQSPPAHDGGMLGADEGQMLGRTMRAGEGLAVVNQRGQETIDRLNRDTGQGRSEPARLVLEDAGRVLGEALLQSSRRPGSPVYAAGSPGAVDPYRSSR